MSKKSQPKIGIGIREQMETSNAIPYVPLVLTEIEKLMKDLTFSKIDLQEQLDKALIKHPRRKLY
tara:strand:+ start:5866 stop:6060 length:195 start_codon:yes stop_codon:yes gene_type:complete